MIRPILGPRAIFDPNYIPPRVLFRTKEIDSVHSILNDSLTDEFSVNLLIQGIQGIGKRLIVNYTTFNLMTENTNEIPLLTINLNCKEKNFEELIGSAIAEMSKFPILNFNLESILNSKISHLLNTFKLAVKKINVKNNINLFLILLNSEHLKAEEFKKFLLLGKEMNITTISTVNKVLRANTLDLLSEFDTKQKLDYFSYNELFSILSQRASLTFSHEIDKELIEYISDLIFEHYVPVPGKGIDIFREIYPFLKIQKSIKQSEMLKLCQNQFDSAFNIDEFSMIDYISEDILSTIFLDNLSNYFLNNSNCYYLTLKELKELYDISCESLEYEKNDDEFKKIIKKIRRIGILIPSKKNLIEEKYIFNAPSNCIGGVYFFSNVNPLHLKNVCDAVFQF